MKKKKRYDEGLDELLALLQNNPQIVRDLVFEQRQCQKLLANLKRKLKSRRARQIVSQPVLDFLGYVAEPPDGYAIAQCSSGTQFLCAKGTGQLLVGRCGSGTQPAGS